MCGSHFAAVDVASVDHGTFVLSVGRRSWWFVRTCLRMVAGIMHAFFSWMSSVAEKPLHDDGESAYIYTRLQGDGATAKSSFEQLRALVIGSWWC